MYFLIASLWGYGQGAAGYRIFCTETKAVKDVKRESLVNAILNGDIVIQNAEVKEKSVVTNNGNIKRYPFIIDGKDDDSKSSLIVLSQLRLDDGNLVGYRVVDRKGNCSVVKTKALIAYHDVHGIANGYVKNIGRNIICSINGEYHIETVGANYKGIEKREQI